MVKTKKKKVIQTTGMRKKAEARANIYEGKGMIRVNSKLIDYIEPEYVRMRVKEPIIITNHVDKDIVPSVNIDVKVNGGGIWGQADAARTAIANALIQWSKNKDLKQAFLDYDRTIVISDYRRTEPHKPSRSSAGPRRMKQQSKR